MNGGGAFAIVFLMVLVVLGAGFLFNEDIENKEKQAIAREVEIQMVETNKDLASQKTALEEENRRLAADVQRLTQELEAARQTNTTLSTDLEAANTARNICSGELSSSRGENAALKTQLVTVTEERQACDTQLELEASANADLAARYVAIEQELEKARAQIAELQSTPIPVTGDCPLDSGAPGSTTPLLPASQEYFAWPVIAIIAMALFGAAALFTWQGRGAKTRRTYAAEDDSPTYVKMTRSEARRYAQARRKR